MNKENIDKAIAIMERARGRLNMGTWQQQVVGKKMAFKEEQLHSCGNTACFAGWIAVSPEFRESGGTSVGHTGAPTIRVGGEELFGSFAIQAWLDIPANLAHALVHGRKDRVSDDPDYCRYYRKYWTEVTVDDVITKLRLIRDDS